MALGLGLAHAGVLGQDSQRVLSRLVYFVATPALLIDLLSRTDVSDVLGVGFAIAGISVLAVLVVYVPLAIRRGRSMSHVVIGALSASYANGGYLGLPIAVYVLGDAAFAVPIMVLQLIVYAPLALSVLDLDATGRRPTIGALALAGVRNPVSVGAMCGVLISVAGLELPEIVGEPLALLGGMAVPGALLAYGVSLRFGGAIGSAHRREIAVIALLKLVWMPAVAYVVARFAFGLDSHEVFGLTVMAALPTAQNVFVYASRFQRSELLARDSVAVTTLVAIPVLFGLAAILA
ncbi:AEC family transporter [Aeromicrobium sp.]|uniref:AEC family transporter n=1 Tax=Aeromicrobium sp. TaxID=1871063 RepID=UPI002FCA3ABE